MVDTATETTATASGIPPAVTPARDVKENADLVEAKAALARLRQDIQSNPNLSEDVKRALIQSLDGLLHNNQISAAALNAARQQIERQYTTLKTEEGAEQLVASAIQITRDDKVKQAEVSASLFNYYFDDGFGCEAPPEVRKDFERMVNAALDLRPAGGGPSLAEAIAKIPKSVRDAAQKVEEVEKIKIDQMIADPAHRSYHSMLRIIKERRIYGNPEIQDLVEQIKSGKLNSQDKDAVWDNFNRILSEIKTSTQPFREPLLKNLDEKFKGPLAAIGDPRTEQGNDAIEERFHRLMSTPEGKKRMEQLLKKDYSTLSNEEKTDVAVYHYQAAELTVRGISQLRDTTENYLAAIKKREQGQPLKGWEENLIRKMEPLTSDDPVVRKQGTAALLKGTDIKNLPSEQLNALAEEFSKKPITINLLEKFVNMKDHALADVAAKATGKLFGSAIQSASAVAAGAAGAVAGAGGGVAAEAGKLLDDVGRRAGTAFKKAGKGMEQVKAGDWDGAIKTGEVAVTAAVRFIRQVPGLAAISLGNASDGARDGVARRDALGKALEKQLDSINRLASSDTRLKNALDKDGDGRVELWELKNKLKEAGITKLVQMDKNGDKQVSAEEIRAALMPSPTPKAPHVNASRPQHRG